MPTSTNDRANVETASGPVRGQQSDGVYRFLGIPYGADTIAHRFQPAAQPRPWTQMRECFEPGAQAPQGPVSLMGLPQILDGPGLPIGEAVQRDFAGNVPESEDCLFLNVLTLCPSYYSKRPVMVWLHGGAFACGVGYNAMTEGGTLVTRGDVVLVSVNHRLNALGYLYLGAFHEDFEDSGNVGHLDIVLALRWVRDNISAFGGDPDNVTIFGESGGGAKVGALLGMLPARGLFHRAIEQSGPAVRLVDRADAIDIAERTLSALGVGQSHVHELQSLDRSSIIAAASAAVSASGVPGLSHNTLAPCIDGRSFLAHPFDPVATGVSATLPLMIGTTKDEWTQMLALGSGFNTLDIDGARQEFLVLDPDRGAAAFELYRSARPNDPPVYWLSAFITDIVMRNGSILAADRKSIQNAAPVYMYRVDYEPRVLNGILRSTHSIDVPLVFGTLVPRELIGSGPEVEALSEIMMKSWIDFAYTGNPGREDLEWPAYDTMSRMTMIFDNECRAMSDPDRVTRAFWQ